MHCRNENIKKFNSQKSTNKKYKIKHTPAQFTNKSAHVLSTENKDVSWNNDVVKDFSSVENNVDEDTLTEASVNTPCVDLEQLITQQIEDDLKIEQQQTSSRPRRRHGDGSTKT